MNSDAEGSPTAPTPRPWIQGVQRYDPGRPGRDDSGSLASNELPFAPAAGVTPAVVRALERLHHYPDPLATELRHHLAVHHSVDPEQILVGNGSDQLMYLLVLAYASGGGTVVCADPPYALHRLIPEIMGAKVEMVPLRGWVHDLPRMAERSGDLTFVCNPHNPTGTTVTASAVENLVKESGRSLVVVDEAYIDFCTAPEETTCIAAAGRGEAVVLRSFSKSMGLAGARIGYAVAARQVIETLRSIRPVYSVNSLAQVAAIAALADTEHQQRVRLYVADMRARLARVFESAGYQTIRSEANFILVLAPDEKSLCTRLMSHGISVRPGHELGFPGSIRVAIPSEEGLIALEKVVGESGVGPSD